MITPLDLPELHHYIAAWILRQDTPRQDLVSCVLVCRRWHHSYLPFLWQTIHLYPGWQDSPSSPDGPLLAKYCHFIRSLQVKTTDGLHEYLGACTNLKTLMIYGDQPDKDRLWADLTCLIRRNPSIEWIILGLGLNTAPSPEFLRALPSACPNLKRYESSRGRYDQPAQLEALLEVFSRIKTASSRNEYFTPFLTSGITEDPSPPSHSPSPELSVIKGRTFPNIWELTLKNASGLDISSQLDLVCQCPSLQSLKWTVRPEDALPAQEICKRIPSACPKLTQLQMDGCGLPYPDDIGQIVGSFPILDRLILCGIDITHNAFTAMKKHFSTLHTLDLIDCLHVESWMIQEILERCSTMISIMAPSILMKDIAAGQGWAALGLTHLQVTLVASHPSDIKEQRAVWSEIAKLTRLSNLFIGGHRRRTRQGLEVLLDAGMDRIHCLTKLKKLSIGAACQRMTMEEAEWMLLHLENMKCLEGYFPPTWWSTEVAQHLIKSGIVVKMEDVPWVEPSAQSDDEEDDYEYDDYDYDYEEEENDYMETSEEVDAS
ncbi:hypothetical protein EMPS_00232 [Entomortierella parvispora]|uniref:F-box domain-containing protein n=1 Tax=Entomortierella parvispora TaxID=205924 RepID=A0A9P3LR26_9FUNG|nr:hypothetical protein EMPS_00232 [Entomortierella parvispora]